MGKLSSERSGWRRRSTSSRISTPLLLQTRMIRAISSAITLLIRSRFSPIFVSWGGAQRSASRSSICLSIRDLIDSDVVTTTPFVARASFNLECILRTSETQTHERSKENVCTRLGITRVKRARITFLDISKRDVGTTRVTREFPSASISESIGATTVLFPAPMIICRTRLSFFLFACRKVLMSTTCFLRSKMLYKYSKARYRGSNSVGWDFSAAFEPMQYRSATTNRASSDAWWPRIFWSSFLSSIGIVAKLLLCFSSWRESFKALERQRSTQPTRFTRTRNPIVRRRIFSALSLERNGFRRFISAKASRERMLAVRYSSHTRVSLWAQRWSKKR
mmetsp:Transcript_5090/g.12332  ORF Transcript_5090/g.12332 Transcript_5090/m.12332 type:complete len:336 (+) Transcript_5090:4625-5632(+)